MLEAYVEVGVLQSINQGVCAYYGVFLLFFLSDVFAARSCVSVVARVVSTQGTVELRHASDTYWQPAEMNAVLCAGDRVRVRARSRAALRLTNESMLRLDQKTAITFPELEEEAAISLIDLLKGAIHILTRTPMPFKVTTPFVNAGVDGTEFSVRVDDDSTQLVIYEGRVSVNNDQGQLRLLEHESAIAVRDQAPQKVALVNPSEAVQWALYYPTVIDYRLDQAVSTEPAVLTEISSAIAFYQRGQLTAALLQLDRVPQDKRTARFLTFYVSLLLSIGRVDEARAGIEQVLKLEPDNSDAHALQAMIAIVQNEKAAALRFATQAVAFNRLSPAAHIALSYVQQANFEISEALESVQRAVTLDSENALAWARLAELQMAMGEPDYALAAAQQAVSLNPNLAKTQTVLGFAHLLQIDTVAARQAFIRAIAFDQADPLPRLGLGLALTREGHLEAGRIELEIAVSLDPASSLIRSYLGKVYFEEKRYGLASTQFDLAKKSDPQDPTPWLYDAIQKQTQNRPVEALQDLQRSIELNANRAVYRSRLLLDQDQAARGSSLARIFDNLGFEKRALVETASALSLDPGNHSTHRFLSDIYTHIPRHEIARVSELLQAQLLQPINVNPVQPRLAVADLNIITGTGPAIVGFNEFTPLVERNRPQLVASGIVGSHETLGDEVVASAVYDRASISMGQFYYRTDGFRPNNDQKHHVYNAFLQYAVTPRFNIQAEVRTHKAAHGDLLLDFNHNAFKKDQRRELMQDMARMGANYKLSSKQSLIASAAYTYRRENQRESFGPANSFNEILKDQGYQVEAQYLYRDQLVNVTMGAGTYEIAANSQIRTDLMLPNGPISNQTAHDFMRERRNGYIYTNFNYFSDLSTTLGLSYDAFKEDGGFEIKKFNPKIGLQWSILSNLRLRLALFETVKSSLIANQTIEPTQVAGFNQMFDDVNGTRAQRKGFGLDARITHHIFSGIEVSSRDLKVPIITQHIMENQKEKLYRAYLYWLPHPFWAIKGEAQFEKFMRQPDLSSTEPNRIETLSAPVAIQYFNPHGLFAKLTGTYVRQELERQGRIENAGIDHFFLFDATLGYRFPNRMGMLSLEGRNLLNDHFFFRNVNFQLSEAMSPRFIPTRTIFARLTLNF